MTDISTINIKADKNNINTNTSLFLPASLCISFIPKFLLVNTENYRRTETELKLECISRFEYYFIQFPSAASFRQ